MALKRKLTAEEHADLPADVKKEYKKVGAEFVLDVDGDEDTGALKRAKDRATADAKKLKEERDALQAQLDETTDGDARKAGDIAKLEKGWQKKIDDQKAAYEATIAKKDGFIRQTLVDNVARDVAHKISTAPGLMLPHIKSRLTADLSGDEPATKVLGPDGKPSNLSIDDLQKEFVANKDFSSIIVASKATGGGAAKGLAKPSSGTPATGEKPPAFSEMKPTDLAASLKERVEATRTGEAAT